MDVGADMEIDHLYLNIIVGTLLPLLVGVVTKSQASRLVKTIVNALLSAIGGVLAPILATCVGLCVLDYKVLILSAGTTWIASIATYYGFWDPSGIDDKVHSVTSAVGVG